MNGNTTLTGLPNGDHNVAIYSIDEFGNAGASETDYFSVKEPFPTTSIGVTITIATVIIAVTCLMVYFKKRKH